MGLKKVPLPVLVSTRTTFSPSAAAAGAAASSSASGVASLLAAVAAGAAESVGAAVGAQALASNSATTSNAHRVNQRFNNCIVVLLLSYTRNSEPEIQTWEFGDTNLD